MAQKAEARIFDSGRGRPALAYWVQAVDGSHVAVNGGSEQVTLGGGAGLAWWSAAAGASRGGTVGEWHSWVSR